MLYPAKTLNCNGQIVDLSSPKIMGILNVTPDSFYDGGKYPGQLALKRVEERKVLILLISVGCLVDQGRR
jgi:hypothetical protein